MNNNNVSKLDETAALLNPMKLGEYELKNRMIMAPLTRGRSDLGGIPNGLMAEYYAQRATAGLIIGEATAVSAQGHGWLGAPGIYNNEQQSGWAKVAQSVRSEGGTMFLQLWHMGSTVHPDFLGGDQPVSSSSVALTGEVPTPDGETKSLVLPRELTIPEIKEIVADFKNAAIRAVEAGLHGVEIHAANGFLIDQFTRDGVNQRTDEYGGSLDNRLRFLVEVVEAVSAAIGSGKVGVRISPTFGVWGIHDSNPHETFGRAAELLSDYELAYLHVLEPEMASGERERGLQQGDAVTPLLRSKYSGKLIRNDSFTPESGARAIEQNHADAIAYGKDFLANPDFVERVRVGAELNAAKPEKFYSGGADGYTDYPMLEQLATV